MLLASNVPNEDHSSSNSNMHGFITAENIASMAAV